MINSIPDCSPSFKEINCFKIDNIKLLLEKAIIAENAEVKQWYLEQIALQLNCELPEHKLGIEL